MPLLTRYILGEYLKVFVVSAGALAALAFSIDFLEKIRHLYQFQPDFSVLGAYFLLRLPRAFFEMLPLAVLITTLITFGGLSKHNELTALKSAGISLFRMALPLFAFGLFISFLSLHLTWRLVPKAYKEAEAIRTIQIEKIESPGGFVQNKTWLSLDHRRLIYVTLVAPNKARMEGVHLYTLDPDFRLAEEDEAKSLVYETGEWVLLEGTHRLFFKDGTLQSTPFERKTISLNKAPDDFSKAALNLRVATHRELAHYIQRLREDGFDPIRYEVELRGKEALPFANFIMVLLGIPFALKDKRGGGISWGVAISIGVALFYWLVFSTALSLGRVGIFPTWIAGWSANLVFLSVGIYLYLTVKQ